MLCKRCGEDFPKAELRPPSALLRWLALPLLLPFLLRSGVFRGEAFGLYCRPCRRQMNVSFFFVVAVAAIMGLAYVMQKLGLGAIPKA